MNARHRIRIDAKTHERQSGGAVIGTWAPFATNVPADIRAPSGREMEAAGQTQAEVSAVITFRWMPGIEPTMRIVNPYDGDRIYQILAVLPDPTQRRELKLLCSTGLNDG